MKNNQVFLYREKGGVNWCLCKIIAVYEGKVWLHNLHTDSMPMGNVNKYKFKSAKAYLEGME